MYRWNHVLAVGIFSKRSEMQEVQGIEKYLHTSLYSQAQIVMTFSVDYAHADTPTHINSFIRTYPGVYRSDRDDMGSKYCKTNNLST